MSNNISIYLIEEIFFPTSLQGSDVEKHYKLTNVLKNQGNMIFKSDIGMLTFIDTLKVIDDLIRGAGFLWVFALNNSPNKILGSQPNCDSFGYFSSEQAKDLYLCLEEIKNIKTESAQPFIDRYNATNNEMFDDLFSVMYMASKAANEKACAIAVLYE